MAVTRNRQAVEKEQAVEKKQAVEKRQAGEKKQAVEKKEAEGKKEERKEVTREKLIELLNEDLAREYQAVIAYVVYSQVLKGAEYMTIAKELEIHAAEELDHALRVSRHIDYLGGMPTVTAKPVRTSENAVDMLNFDLEAENLTVRSYRERLLQCQSLGLYAIAEDIRHILVQEQEHQIDLATALGKEVAEASKPEELV